MNQATVEPLASLRQLVAALQQPSCFDHDVSRFETIETHISIVLLTGDFAYKFKKPVDLGFVDFTSLDKRRYFCEEELRLNRRLAPEIYLDVVSIGGKAYAPVPGSKPIIEYCVKMRQFPHSAELENALENDEVNLNAFRKLAQTVAEFHDRADTAADDSGYGAFSEVQSQCTRNFQTMAESLPDLDLSADMPILQEWTDNELSRHRDLIEQRRLHGRVRECHGDMHVTNMIWLDGLIRIFDCIEFNPELRWIDVMNEVAFLLMDLDMRDHEAYARVFLNAYLETGGDYEGLRLLLLFQVYRSLVRAKIAFLQARDGNGNSTLRERVRGYVRLARQYIEQPASPALIITHGLSGSGKTTLTDGLIPLTGAIRVRSDVERKRLAGLTAAARSNSGVGQALYGSAHTERTYATLADCARSIIASGRSAIIDATFLKRAQRLPFRDLAGELGVPFRILDCQASEDVLRERVKARSREGQDASEADLAVLERQLSTIEALTGQEREFAVILETTKSCDPRELMAALGL